MELYWPKGVDEGAGTFRGRGGGRVCSSTESSPWQVAPHLEDVKELMLKLLDLSMAKGTQQVVAKDLRAEIEGGGEDKPGMEVSRSGGTVKYTPRQRRVLVDAMYDLALFKVRAEKDFPADNVRTRFWVSSAVGKYAESIKFDLLRPRCGSRTFTWRATTRT